MATKYKDSGIPWMPTIPDKWDVQRGKNILVLNKRPVRESDEVVTCFRDGEVVLRSERRTDGFTMSDKEIGYQGINKGDIVIHGMDGFAGSMGVSKSTGKGSPVLVVCSPKYDAVPQFIIYYLRTLAMTNVFVALSTGIRERSCDLRWNKIAELQFALPSAIEQQRIADFLDRKCAEIDELAALQETMIEELKLYKQSLITETVTKGLDKNAKMKPSGVEWIGEIPEGWDVRKLKRFGYLYGGLSGKSGDDFNVDEETDNYALYVPFTNIFNNTVINPNVFHKVKVNADENQNEVHCGDILFLMSSEDYEGVGKSALVNCVIDKLYLNSFCKGLRITSERIHSPYLNYLLLSTPIRNHIMVMANGFIRINLRAEKLGTLTILIPPLTEQQQIADYLDRKCAEIDELIAIKQQKIEALKEYKKSVIFEYVTGKKEII
jgi:Restriction endonuclease S subunits